MGAERTHIAGTAMKALHMLLCAVLSVGVLHTSLAQAWQLRGGSGARTFVVPHGSAQGGRPMPPAPRPMPHPMPHPVPHPAPHPHPGPHPAPNPHPQPGPAPYPPRPIPPPPPPPPPHPDDWYHPWATAAVIGATTATALAIGTQVASVPPDCVSVVANNVAYQHCGSTWYQPRYVGSTVQFVVVPAPW